MESVKSELAPTCSRGPFGDRFWTFGRVRVGLSLLLD